MTTELREDQLVHDTILYLPVDVIDPDPAQPRLAVDAELADSIAQHGVLQAIEVRPHPESADRWMITDGERRWRGAVAAKLATIKCTIALDVEDAADRLVRQIVRNEGKPLTPVEEAKAFKRIIDERRAGGDKHYGVVQLAKELGIAKSTVSDRLALLDIPGFWLDLMVTGPLQPSHAPILRRWRLVPEKYQLQALEQMKADYRWPGALGYSKGKAGERIYGDVLETLVRTYMTKFIKPVSEVPGYEGPTERGRFESYGDSTTYAMDPSKWGPIHRKRIAANRSKQAKEAAETKQQNEARKPAWVKAALEGGAEHRQLQYFSISNAEYDGKYSGITWIIDRGRWHFRSRVGEAQLYDPTVLCEKLDLTKLLIVSTTHQEYTRGKYRDVTVWNAGTRDDAALGQARSAFLTARTRLYANVGAAFIAQAERQSFTITGAGTAALLQLIADDSRGAKYLYDIAAALEVPDVLNAKKDLAQIFGKLDGAVAERIASIAATATARGLKSVDLQLREWQEEQFKTYSHAPIALGGATDAPDPADEQERAIADDVDEDPPDAGNVDYDEVDDEMLGIEEPEPAHAGAED